jgi:endo-1,4-beta-xylanase
LQSVVFFQNIVYVCSVNLEIRLLFCQILYSKTIAKNYYITISITKTTIMKYKLFVCLYALFFAAAFSSCKKTEKSYITNFPNATDPGGTLKDAGTVNIGAAVDYNPTVNDAAYLALVKREFDGVTFSYNMKHGAIVKDDGTFDFTAADAMVNACNGLEIFGHTLGWHENQNATYLNNFAGVVAGTGPDLLNNGNFETGSLNGWATYNNGVAPNNATISAGSGTGEVRNGAKSMKVINPVAYGGDQWRVQVASDLFNTVVGSQYTISYWVKAAGGGGSIRLSTQTSGGGSPQYQGDQNIGTTWQNVRWNIVANSAQTRVLFDMGAAANTYFIDDVTATGLTVVAPGPQIAAQLDVALNNYVTTMVNHFRGKVKAWDVVNEVLDNNGNIRNNANSPNTRNASDYFVWSEFLGRDFAYKAFTYAFAADPTATLFINDYGLESNTKKLDSLISYVAELKARGAKVSGIGTQMHITSVTRHDGIDAMMQKLAATGLKIRISELDVKTNIAEGTPYTLTPLDAYGQEQMYKYVIASYKKYIPQAQQFGITIWGVSDDKSWLYNGGKDFPLLFNGDYSKKSTYAATLTALKAQ